MFNCIIVDDEMPAREELKFLLKDYKDIRIIGEAEYGIEAIELCKSLKPNMIFLDIQMPKMNGIEVAEKLGIGEWLPIVIFTTAYDDFAIKAFETHAVDYLLKPISKDRLNLAIQKSRKILKTINHNQTNGSNKSLENIKSIKKVCLYKNGSLVPIAFDEIIYAVVENGQTQIMTEKDCFDYHNPLNHLEDKLVEGIFFRCHRSYLINLNYVEKIEAWFNGTYMVQLKGCKEKIPVSRNKVKEFKKIMAII
ncbi:LytTR family two component transcriptional regulator [Natranaerovirga hydrolytica]|uniref:Stage 0 sporulation protein A homolog n=1 Tax=Natranaerovirga hydrolytica TaxID=680378 RepID=A0A4R1MIR6_9FIRM|nr:LytTR family DNA-binding domain-containing protein [Natranaerovirga hydrolytica]TCK92618.1 LytTR family two component transcriptional regulator [Natranaerovirga hydrolytica]